MQAIGQMHQLKTLTINGYDLEALFPTLHKLSSLQELLLNGSHLGERAVETLANSFTGCPSSSIQRVSLKCCQLSDQSIAKIVNVLHHLPKLECLDLVGNHCCQLGIQALANLLLQSSATLQRLDLSFQLGAMVIFPLAHALADNTSLTVLRLPGNGLDDKAMSCLARVALASTNTSLQHLDLSANDIGNEGLEVLGKALCKNHCLQSLNLKYNPISNLSVAKQWLVQNDSLESLEHSCCKTKQLQQWISYLCRLNQGGRRLLRQNPPPSVWPLVLERCASSDNADAIFYLLQCGPILREMR
jgi:Ran GTPase-activating protein (RanGAP) involved in mRNA processing and transport